MYFKDIAIGFIVALIILIIARFVQPFVTNAHTKKFFFPALIFKMISALLLGIIYYFHYKGGDTFTYFTRGAIHIYEAFWDDPSLAWQLLFGEQDYSKGVYKYASKIFMYKDFPSYIVVRFAGFISIFVGGSYVATSLIFSVLSFTGIWAMYTSFTKLFLRSENIFSFPILFIPSTLFWASGILKDTITFGLLGWSVAAFIHIIYDSKKKMPWLLVMGMALSLFVIYQIKIYIIMSIAPAFILWAYLLNLSKIKNLILRYMVAPFLIVFSVFISFYTVSFIGQTDSMYKIENIAKTAQIKAYDVGRYTGKNAGSRYDLGDLDTSFANMLKLAPAAINVTLFRPYLWEVTNPLMLLAALEALMFLFLTIVILLKSRYHLLAALKNPVVIFSLFFSLSFAFFVGVSTYNFGTLFRYKVPMMPFYGIFLAILWLKSSPQLKNESPPIKIK